MRQEVLVNWSITFVRKLHSPSCFNNRNNSHDYHLGCRHSDMEKYQLTRYMLSKYNKMTLSTERTLGGLGQHIATKQKNILQLSAFPTPCQIKGSFAFTPTHTPPRTSHTPIPKWKWVPPPHIMCCQALMNKINSLHGKDSSLTSNNSEKDQHLKALNWKTT